MKFGKEFRTHLEETLPDWRDKFLCYKPLKKLIKHHIPPGPEPLHPHSPREDSDDAPAFAVAAPAPAPAGGAIPRWLGIEEWFLGLLEEELDKFNDFYVDKEEDFIIRLQVLKNRIERLREHMSGDLTSKSEFSEELLEIRRAFVTMHGEMVLLKNYSSLNFAGLVKILKKYDKRTGALLSLPFTQRALHQPFFATEPLTRLVRECEATLELLFPLEAEVIESDPPETMERTEPSSVRDKTDDVYKSTLAAMKAIRGLRKASSTYNPLSLAQFFHDQDDDDGSGVVTDGNSVSNSLTTSENKEADEVSVHSGD